MSKREEFLSLILHEIKEKIPKNDLLSLFSYVGMSSTYSFPTYDFIKINNKIISFELERDLSKLFSDNIIFMNGHVQVLDRQALKKQSQKIHIDAQLEILRHVKHFFTTEVHCTIESAKHKPIQKTNTIFTSGYEGNSLDSFLNKIITSGVKKVIDVRKNPISRKFGFSKKTLSAACETINIAYEHFSELGIPSEARQELKTQKDYDILFSAYEKEILSVKVKEQNEVLEIAKEMPSVLICYEANPMQCHRTRIAKSLSNRSRMGIINL